MILSEKVILRAIAEAAVNSKPDVLNLVSKYTDKVASSSDDLALLIMELISQNEQLRFDLAKLLYDKGYITTNYNAYGYHNAIGTEMITAIADAIGGITSTMDGDVRVAKYGLESDKAKALAEQTGYLATSMNATQQAALQREKQKQYLIFGSIAVFAIVFIVIIIKKSR